MSMRSLKEQNERLDAYIEECALREGLAVLFEAAAMQARYSVDTARFVRPMTARELADATGDYEAIGGKNGRL